MTITKTTIRHFINNGGVIKAIWTSHISILDVVILNKQNCEVNEAYDTIVEYTNDFNISYPDVHCILRLSFTDNTTQYARILPQ